MGDGRDFKLFNGNKNGDIGGLGEQFVYWQS